MVAWRSLIDARPLIVLIGQILSALSQRESTSLGLSNWGGADLFAKRSAEQGTAKEKWGGPALTMRSGLEGED